MPAKNSKQTVSKTETPVAPVHVAETKPQEVSPAPAKTEQKGGKKTAKTVMKKGALKNK